MQLHENQAIKSLGVAGIALRSMDAETHERRWRAYLHQPGTKLLRDKTMNPTMKTNGYTIAISFNIELKMFRGEFIDLNNGADFYAYSVVVMKRSEISAEAFLVKYG